MTDHEIGQSNAGLSGTQGPERGSWQSRWKAIPGRRLGVWGTSLGGAALAILTVAFFTERWVAWPAYPLAAIAIFLGLVGISRTSRGYAGAGTSATLPEIAFGTGALFVVVAAGLAYRLGPITDTAACYPFESCDAVVELVLTEEVSVGEFKEICATWNELDGTEQQEFVDDWTARTPAIAGAVVADLFEDPDRAYTALAPAIQKALNRQC